MSPASPHFLNQAPSREQQLDLPDFLIVPHLGHTRPIELDLRTIIAGLGVPRCTNVWVSFNATGIRNYVRNVKSMNTCFTQAKFHQPVPLLLHYQSCKFQLSLSRSHLVGMFYLERKKKTVCARMCEHIGSSEGGYVREKGMEVNF